MRIHKMNKWDAGQDLTSCADYLGEKEKDLRQGGFVELAEVVRKARLQIGTAFNHLGSHSFGLPDEKNP